MCLCVLKDVSICVYIWRPEADPRCLPTFHWYFLRQGGDLNAYVPQRLRGLNAGTVCAGLGGVALLRDTCPLRLEASCHSQHPASASLLWLRCELSVCTSTLQARLLPCSEGDGL